MKLIFQKYYHFFIYFFLFLLIVFGLVKGFSPTPSWQSQIEKKKAFYIAQAGIEYALAQIDQGGSPVVEEKVFDGGYFSTAINNKQHSLSVKSVYKNEETKYVLHIPLLASDCVEYQVIQKDSRNIELHLRKKCLTTISIERIQFFLKNPSHDLPAIESLSLDGNILESFSQAYNKASYLSLSMQKLTLTESDSHVLLFSFKSNFTQENLNTVLGFSDQSELLLKPLVFK